MVIIIIYEICLLVGFFFLFIIFSLLSISFITLWEQKLIGSCQLRPGPNYRGFVGLLQPFSDGLKLFGKYGSTQFNFSSLAFRFTPFLMLGTFELLWFLDPIPWVGFNIPLGFLFFLFLTGLFAIFIYLIGWFSNCKYSLLGCLRGVAQIVSYELCFGLVIICFCTVVKCLRFFALKKFSYLFLPLLPAFFIWVFAIFVERHRTPFDFLEGESELVSGFNTEYAGGPFAVCYISEYMSLLFISLFRFFIFFFIPYWSLFAFSCLLFLSLFIIARCFLPRYRYDKVIHLCWKVFIPFLLFFLVVLFEGL